MAQNIVEILIKLKDDTASGLKAVQSGLSGLESAANTVSGAVFNLRNSIAGIAIGAGLTQVITQFAQFDDSMRAAGTIAGATGQEFKKMTDLALKMGIDTKFKASEAADAMVKLGYSSFKAGEQIAALPSILDMAAAGGISLADSAGIASTVIRAFNMDASESGHVADVITKAFTSTSTTMGELGEAWKYVAPIAAGVGASFEELIGTLGILSNAGIKGSMGGTTLRITLDTLLNPTKEEAEQMKALGDRIGGAGLQIKDSQGNFLGFANIVRQLEDAGMRAEEALKLFGARGGPGMAALLSQGSDAIANMSTQLENADGTAKKIATDMTAGLGGSIVFLKSSIESFFLSLGSGLDAPFKQFIYDITADLNQLIYAIKAAKDDGSLEKWMKVGVDALRSFYETMKSAAEGVWSFIQSNSGLVESLIKLAPTIVTVATAAAGLGMAIATVKAGLAVFALTLSPISGILTAMAPALYGVGAAATASQAALALMGTAVIALGAVFGAFKIGQLAVELYNTQKVMSETEARTKTFTAEMASTRAEFEKFKDVKIPDDLTGQSLESLQALHQEVRGGIQYWTAYVAEMRATGKDSGADFQNALNTLNQLKESSEKVKSAMKGYADNYKIELKAAEEAHKNHVNLIKDIADKQGKSITDAMYKSIEVEEQAYKKGEISYEEFQNRKKSITEKAESEIASVRLKAAEQIQKTESTQIEYTQAAGEKRIALIKEQVQAGLITAQQGNAQIESAEKQTSDRIAQIKQQAGNAVIAEQKKIDQERVKNYLASLKEEESAAKDAYKSKMDAIKQAEDQGKISHSEAWKGRLEVEKNYLTQSLQAANANFERAKAAYPADSAQFKAALDQKKKALDDYYNKEKDIADKVKALQDQINQAKLSAEEKVRSIMQGAMSERERYQDKEAQYYEYLNKSISLAGTNQKEALEYAQKAIDKAGELTGAVDENGKTYITAGAAAQNAASKVTEASSAQQAILKGQISDLKNYKTEITAIPAKIGIATDITEVKNGVATVKTEMSQITGDKKIPVKVEYDPSTVNEMRNELNSLTQQATIIQAKIDTAQPGTDIDALKARLAEVNTQAQSLQAKLNADQPKQEIAQTEAAAKQAQSTIAQPTTMPVETGDAQKNVESVGMSADDIQKKIEAGTKMTVDTSQPEQALDKVEQKTDAIDKEPVSVDVQVKSQGIEETQNKLGQIPDQKTLDYTAQTSGFDEAKAQAESLPREIEAKYHVKATMEGSSTQPLSDKVESIKSEISGLNAAISEPQNHHTVMTGDAGNGAKKLSESLTDAQIQAQKTHAALTEPITMNVNAQAARAAAGELAEDVKNRMVSAQKALYDTQAAASSGLSANVQAAQKEVNTLSAEYESLTKQASAEVPVAVSTEKATSDLSAVNEKVSEVKKNAVAPVELNIKTDVANAAMSELYSDLEKRAVQAAKQLHDAQATARDLGGSYGSQAALESARKESESLNAELVKLKKEMDNINNNPATLTMKGKASPVTGAVEMLDNVTSKMDGLSSKISDQEMTVSVSGMDEVSNLGTQLDTLRDKATIPLKSTGGGGIADMLNQISSGGGAGLGSAQQAWSQKYGAEKSMELSNLVSQAIAPAINKMAFPDVGAGASVDISKMFEGVKDLGKTELQIGGKAYPIVAKQDVIGIMQDELRRMKMTGAMR